MQPLLSVLSEVTRHQAEVRGDKAALRFGADVTDYRSLHPRVCRVANGLNASRVGRGDRVVTRARNSSAYYEILFGAAASGAVLLPINWRLADSEIEWILRDAPPRALFVGPQFYGRVRDLWQGPGLMLRLDVDGGYPAWRDSHSCNEPTHAAVADDVVVQLYTSGTTGKPRARCSAIGRCWPFGHFRPKPSPSGTGGPKTMSA